MIDGMSIPLSEAAKQVGKTKQTIIKAIRSGRISAEKNQTGEWRIEPVELFRLWPPVNQLAGNTPIQVHGSSPPVDGEVVALLKAQIADIQDERDHWRSMAEKLLLSDQRSQKEGGFWSRLMRRS